MFGFGNGLVGSTDFMDYSATGRKNSRLIFGYMILVMQTGNVQEHREKTDEAGDEMKKIVLVTYNPEVMCFGHVLLYALDFDEKGYEAKIVIEGGAVKLVSVFTDPNVPFAPLFAKVKEKGLIDCVCKACSAKLGSLEDAKAQGLPVAGDLMGHPSIEAYLQQGYQLITF
jgi:hypothetical protein